MLPNSRGSVERWVAYRDKLLSEGKATGFLKYSINMVLGRGDRVVKAPAVQVRRNKLGIRGLFAATELPIGFQIPFDGEYVDTDIPMVRSNSTDGLYQLNQDGDQITCGDGKHIFIPYVVSSMNLAQCVNAIEGLSETANAVICSASDFDSKPYIQLTEIVNKGQEILVDYGKEYTKKFNVPRSKPQNSQFRLAKILVNNKAVGVARHVCQCCDKIVSRKQKPMHVKTGCEKVKKHSNKFKYL